MSVTWPVMVDLKERILNTVTIEGYIGRHVALKRAGRHFKGLCPFHTEKSASFVVSPEKGLYYCFGCGKGGDIFRFVMDYEGLSFSEALGQLARFAGIETKKPLISAKRGAEEELFSRCRQVNARATASFREYLQTDGALSFRNYLDQRAITQEAQAAFQLGACPQRWEWLAEREVGEREELLRVGLLQRGKEGRPPYDFFRGRIIFPIHDSAGQVLGFGGRLLPGQDKQAKYINSPDSPIFHKKQIVYGLWQNLAQIRNRREALIVEGYLDVIALWQKGICYACAPLGTALAVEQLRLLSRYADRLTALFDGDQAGRSAALRYAGLMATETALVTAQVILLPPGYDPCDLASSLSAAQLEGILECRASAQRFYLLETLYPGRFIAYAESQNWLDDPRQFASQAQSYYGGALPQALPSGLEKRAALERLYLALRDFALESQRHIFLEEAAQLLRLDANEVKREWSTRYRPPATAKSALSPSGRPAAGRPAGSSFLTPSETVPSNSSSSDRMQQNLWKKRLIESERRILGELLSAPQLMGAFYRQLQLLEFEDPCAEMLFRHLEARLLKGDDWSANSLHKLQLPDEVLAVFSSILLRREEEEGVDNFLAQEETIEEYLLQHRVALLEKEIAELKRGYVVADCVEKRSFLEQENRLIRQLSELKAQLRHSPALGK